MCLSSVNSKKPAKTGIFYKAFRQDGGGGVFNPLFQRTALRFVMRKWYKDTSEGNIYIYCPKDASYPKGFHGYKNLKDAKIMHGCLYTIVKCQYQKAVVSGRQGCGSAIVAKEMKLLKVVRKCQNRFLEMK